MNSIRSPFWISWLVIIFGVGLLWLAFRFMPFIPFFDQSAMMRFPDKTEWQVDVARSPQALERGLSGRESLLKGEGMLFVFPSAGRPMIWMKNMKFPLDIIWLNQWIIVDKVESAPLAGQNPEVSYLPEADADMVLEVPAGTMQKHGLKLGDPLDIIW